MNMIRCRIRELAEKKELNRHALAVRSGISYPTVQRWWDNTNKGYDREVLNKLCDALECQPGDLLVHISDASSP